MEKGLFHIASETTTTLVSKYSKNGLVKSISICNQHAATTAVVSLYLSDDTNDSYIIKNVSIPAGVSLLLDHSISFDSGKLAMKLTNTGGTPLSVIMK